MAKIKVFISGEKSRLQNYIKALSAQKIQAVFDEQTDCDGLVLTGGGDISPCFYKQPLKGSKNIDIERDCLEFYLIKKYFSQGKPILGICRGMQVLNVYFGGTLIQDMKSDIHCYKGQNKDKKHVNRTVNGTFCNALYGDLFLSNSSHHQAVDLLGNKLIPSAYCLDGTMEAFEGKNLIAVQFHPERMDEDLGKKIFYHFKNMLC